MRPPRRRTFRIRLSDAVSSVLRFLRLRGPHDSDDPYAGVRAPKSPRFPRRSASVALMEPD